MKKFDFPPETFIIMELLEYSWINVKYFTNNNNIFKKSMITLKK